MPSMDWVAGRCKKDIENRSKRLEDQKWHSQPLNTVIHKIKGGHTTTQYCNHKENQKQQLLILQTFVITKPIYYVI